jgi:predicted RND superfamily exporter protein
MAVGATQLQTGFSMDVFIPQDNQALKLFNNISNDFPFSSQEQEYILIEGDIATVDTIQGIAQTYQNLKNNTYIAQKTDGSIKAESMYSFIQQAVQDNASLLTTYHVNAITDIPATNADVQQLFDYLYNSD